MEVTGAVIVGLLLASLVFTCFLATCAAIIRQKIKLRRQSIQLQNINEAGLNNLQSCHACFSSSDVCAKNRSQYNNSQNFFYLPSPIYTTEDQNWTPLHNVNFSAKQNLANDDAKAAKITSHQQCCSNQSSQNTKSKMFKESTLQDFGE